MMKAMLFAVALMAGTIASAAAQAPAPGSAGHRQPQAHAPAAGTGPASKAHPPQKKHLTRWQRRAECLRRYRDGRPTFNLRKRKWPAFYARCDARLRHDNAPVPKKK
jgi:hypothetical protein